jgi:hypothetical protein
LSTSDRQVRPVGRRARLVSFLSACLAVALLSSAAQAETILQFGQINPFDLVTATEAAGVTTLSTAGNGFGESIPILITNFNGTPGVNILAFETYVGVVSDDVASSGAILTTQRFTGTIIFSSLQDGGGINYLTSTFTEVGNGAVLAGVTGGFQATLVATNPPTSVVFTSDFALLGGPFSMSIGFSNVRPPVGISNDSFASFTAQNAGTFAATVVPEPATFGMACMGLCLVSLGIRYDRRFRRKAARV